MVIVFSVFKRSDLMSDLLRAGLRTLQLGTESTALDKATDSIYASFEYPVVSLNVHMNPRKT